MDQNSEESLRMFVKEHMIWHVHALRGEMGGCRVFEHISGCVAISWTIWTSGQVGWEVAVSLSEASESSSGLWMYWVSASPIKWAVKDR